MGFKNDTFKQTQIASTSYSTGTGFRGVSESQHCKANQKNCDKWTNIWGLTNAILIGASLGLETFGGAGTVEKMLTETPVAQKIINKMNGSNSIYQNYVEKATKNANLLNSHGEGGTKSGAATKNANSTSVMLGKYNQDGISYIKAAGNKHTYQEIAAGMKH